MQVKLVGGPHDGLQVQSSFYWYLVIDKRTQAVAVYERDDPDDDFEYKGQELTIGATGEFTVLGSGP
jgi:hypothetical protein